jgi:pSer/pThr/pTyr-binding forkhead associated (FHA) protein
MALPEYQDEVLITLKSVNPPPDFPFKERRIFLTRQNPTMRIGRTSRKKSCLEATKCNAWFDSPVMSREHAALNFDAKNQVSFRQGGANICPI